jgi:hypothetical protein
VLVQQCHDRGYQYEGLQITRALRLLESEADSHKSPTARRKRPDNQMADFEKKSVNRYLLQQSQSVDIGGLVQDRVRKRGER